MRSLIAAGRQLDARVRPQSVLLDALVGLGPKRQIQRRPQPLQRFSLRVDAEQRQFHRIGEDACVFLRRELQPGCVDFDGERDRRAPRRALERRSLHVEHHAALLNRAVEHRAQLGRCLIGALGAGETLAFEPLALAAAQFTRPRRCVALSCEDAQAGTFEAHVNLVERPVVADDSAGNSRACNTGSSPGRFG